MRCFWNNKNLNQFRSLTGGRIMSSKLPKYLIVMLVGILLLTACGGEEPTATPATAKTPSSNTSSSASVTVNGLVVPNKSADLFFNINGQVSEVLVELGAQVHKGDVLARLNTTGNEYLNANVASSEYELLLAKQELSALTDALAVQQTDALQKLNDAKQVEFDAERDKSYLTDKSTVFQRNQVETKYKIAQARVVQAQAEVDRLNVGPDPKQKEAAEARIKAAEANLAVAKAALKNLELAAPFDATIVDINLAVGQAVTASQSVMKLADLSTLFIETSDLIESKVVKVEIGQLATIIPDSLPDAKLHGKVVYISNIPVNVSGDITYVARISITNPDPLLRWGMTVAITFEK